MNNWPYLFAYETNTYIVAGNIHKLQCAQKGDCPCLRFDSKVDHCAQCECFYCTELYCDNL